MAVQESKHGIKIYVLVRHAKPQVVDVEILKYGIAMYVNVLVLH